MLRTTVPQEKHVQLGVIEKKYVNSQTKIKVKETKVEDFLRGFV